MQSSAASRLILKLTSPPTRQVSARAANLVEEATCQFGQAQNQAYGYLFPHGAFFLLGDSDRAARTQRLWWALTAGFWACCGWLRRWGSGIRRPDHGVRRRSPCPRGC